MNRAALRQYLIAAAVAPLTADLIVAAPAMATATTVADVEVVLTAHNVPVALAPGALAAMNSPVATPVRRRGQRVVISNTVTTPAPAAQPQPTTVVQAGPAGMAIPIAPGHTAFADHLGIMIPQDPNVRALLGMGQHGPATLTVAPPVVAATVAQPQPTPAPRGLHWASIVLIALGAAALATALVFLLYFGATRVTASELTNQTSILVGHVTRETDRAAAKVTKDVNDTTTQSLKEVVTVVTKHTSEETDRGIKAVQGTIRYEAGKLSTQHTKLGEELAKIAEEAKKHPAAAPTTVRLTAAPSGPSAFRVVTP